MGEPYFEKCKVESFIIYGCRVKQSFVTMCTF